MTSKPRTGPKMAAAQAYVAGHPGCTQQQAALAIGPNGSHAFGARAVQRALAAGLIKDERPAGTHAYRLFAR